MAVHDALELQLSIVIPTHNRRRLLRCLLSALAPQAREAACEVIIVDDGSSDGTRDMLDSLSLPCVLRIITGKHKGPAAARNAGLSAARAPVVLFLDDDVFPSPQVVRAHLKRHEADRDAVVIGRLTSCPDRLPGWERWEQTILDRTYDRVLAGKTSVHGGMFYTGNVSARRSSLLAAGGFDVSLAFQEDVDLGMRLEAAGACFYFASDAVARHCGQRGFAGWRQRHYQFGRYQLVRLRRGGPRRALTLGQYHRQLNAITRLLLRLTAGRPLETKIAAGTLSRTAFALDALRLWWLSRYVYSALANLERYQGLLDEAGGRQAFAAVLRGDRDAVASSFEKGEGLG